MKTLRFFFVFGLLAVGLTSFSSAQNKVVKSEWTETFSGIYLECTGDYLSGDIYIQNFQMLNNNVYRLRGAAFTGYTNEACTVPSGREYTLSETFIGTENLENTAVFRMDGKNIANFKFMLRTVTNANGEVKVEIFNLYFICH